MIKYINVQHNVRNKGRKMCWKKKKEEVNNKEERNNNIEGRKEACGAEEEEYERVWELFN